MISRGPLTTPTSQLPASPEIPRVKLRAAFSSLAQFRGIKIEATSIIDARSQLMEIQKTYPDLQSKKTCKTVLDQIDSAFAKKLLDQGEFYERTTNPRRRLRLPLPRPSLSPLLPKLSMPKNT